MPRSPATFTDANGFVRRVRLDTVLLERCRDELGVDLLEVYTGNLRARLCMDPGKLGRVSYLLTEAAEEPADFARACAPVIGDVLDAVIEGVVGFCDALTNGAASRIAGATRETMERATELAIARMRLTDEELERLLDEALRRLSSGAPSTGSPGSSASTPAPSPSDSSPAWPRPAGGTTGTSSPPSSPP